MHPMGRPFPASQEYLLTIALDKSACTNLDTAMGAEWLCTNGLGGYASCTVAGANTRKYHGLQEYLLTIALDKSACTNLDTAMGAEWLCTNGLGGYASCTVGTEPLGAHGSI